jgi:hypothetical protein
MENNTSPKAIETLTSVLASLISEAVSAAYAAGAAADKFAYQNRLSALYPIGDIERLECWLASYKSHKAALRLHEQVPYLSSETEERYRKELSWMEPELRRALLIK